MARYGEEYEGRRYGRYGVEFRRGRRGRRLPGRPARGFPVRGYHTYDLDYGATGGPTTDYSGRAGYPILPARPDRVSELPPRGPYTPILDEGGEDRTLYGGVPPGYRDRGPRRSSRGGQRRGRG